MPSTTNNGPSTPKAPPQPSSSSPPPPPNIPPPVPPHSPTPADDEKAKEYILELWANPLSGLTPGKHVDLESPIRDYLTNIPRPLARGEMVIDVATEWLIQPTNLWVRRLKSADAALSALYNDRILFLQDVVEHAVREFEKVLEQREEAKRELARKEELRKQEAERKLVEREEAARAAKEKLLLEFKQMTEDDPSLLEAVGLQKRAATYPAVAGGQCDNCTAKKTVCVGLAGTACESCYRLHLKCSNANTDRKSKVEPAIPDEAPKAKGRRAKAPAAALTSKPTPASTSNSKKRSANDEDDAESIGSSALRKRTKSDDLLSREEAAELVGGMAMELQTVQQALDQIKASLALFAGKANGKRRVTLQLA